MRDGKFANAIESYESALELKNHFPEGSTFEAEVRAELEEAKEGLAKISANP